MKTFAFIVALTGLLSALASPAVEAAEERIEGTVVSATLTSCEFKPGMCEGTLVLERKDGGKPSRVSVKVPKGTAIKKGNDHLFLPGLKGQTLAVTYAEDKGEKVAKAIEVRPAKP